MENMKQFGKRLLKEESAQGATEYILLLVAVVAVLAMFRTQIISQVEGLLGKLTEGISTATQ